MEIKDLIVDLFERNPIRFNYFIESDTELIKSNYNQIIELSSLYCNPILLNIFLNNTSDEKYENNSFKQFVYFNTLNLSNWGIEYNKDTEDDDRLLWLANLYYNNLNYDSLLSFDYIKSNDQLADTLKSIKKVTNNILKPVSKKYINNTSFMKVLKYLIDFYKYD